MKSVKNNLLFFIACLGIFLPAYAHSMFSHELNTQTTGHLLSSVRSETNTVYLNFPFFKIPMSYSETKKTRLGIPEILGCYTYEHKATNPILQIAVTAYFAALIGTIVYNKYYAEKSNPEEAETTPVQTA